MTPTDRQIAQATLGKQEKDAEATVISGWMARDKNGELVCFPGQNKPFKQEGFPFWCAENREIIESLPKESYPDLTWESDPIEVELTIKRKNIMRLAIEKTAKKFAKLKTVTQAGASVECEKKALLMRQFFDFALEELPLVSRMTASEKALVADIYAESQRWLDEATSPTLKLAAIGIQSRLEAIFSKEFFTNNTK